MLVKESLKLDIHVAELRSNKMLSKTEIVNLGRQNQQESMIVKENRIDKGIRLVWQQVHNLGLSALLLNNIQV